MIYDKPLKTKEPKCLPDGSLNPKWLKALDSEAELQEFVVRTPEYKFFLHLGPRYAKIHP